MEHYLVSARKYRPSTFETVVGQQALTATLKNAIASGRLAHAYLFCGSRGVGKTSCARIFAKTINCTNRTPDGEACNECESCRQFNENRSLNIIELDAASNNSVDDIRDLMNQVVVPPTHGRYRVFIIDEVHMLSSAAFNAFLKTLEEPPAHAIFILATTEKHKILPTILSRCQIYDFNRITISDMVAHMMKVAATEGYTAEPAALSVIAKKADGAMRDALSIFDQVAASTRGNITYRATIENLNVLDHSYYSRLVDAFVNSDVATALTIYKEIRDKGFDSQFFINGLGQYMRDLAMAASPTTLTLVDATDEIRAEMAKRAASLHPTFFYRAMDLCNSADFNFRQATNKQFLIELTLIKLCQQLSPSSDNSGADEGHLKPLESGAATTPQAAQTAPAPAAPRPAATFAPQTTAQTAPQQTAPFRRPAQMAPKAEACHEAPAPYMAGSLSLGNLRAGTSPSARTADAPSETPRTPEKRSKAFTDADIERVWSTTVALSQLGPMLTSLLNATMPVRQGENDLVIQVPSEVQEGFVAAKLPVIQKSIRDALENDSIRVSVVVCQMELPKNLWTDDRVLEDIITAHPGVKHLIDKFKMRRT